MVKTKQNPFLFLQQSIVQTKMKEKPYNNLTKNERKSMKGLGEREDIIIPKANKGGAVVLTM